VEALSAVGLTKEYRGRGKAVRALDRVDLSIAKGRLFGFLGRNGAGKTTFIKIASTLLMPTSGTIALFGDDVVARPNRVRESIALVPQEAFPFYHLTAREHLREYLRVRGFSAEVTAERTEESLSAMGLGPFADTPAFQMSGGQQQRTLVAMVLATRAPFLFLDEPTLGMDPFARRQVWQVIRRVVREGSTVLLTTHYMDEAENLAEELAVIEDGRILYRGGPATLKSTLHREVRLEFGPGIRAEELAPFGRVYTDRGRTVLLTMRSSVRELTELALERHVEVTLGPVTLEEAFLELVGRPIEEADA
jgi:ABC-2 type transport system ATP-binding protein